MKKLIQILIAVFLLAVGTHGLEASADLGGCFGIALMFPSMLLMGTGVYFMYLGLPKGTKKRIRKEFLSVC